MGFPTSLNMPRDVILEGVRSMIRRGRTVEIGRLPVISPSDAKNASAGMDKVSIDGSVVSFNFWFLTPSWRRLTGF